MRRGGHACQFRGQRLGVVIDGDLRELERAFEVEVCWKSWHHRSVWLRFYDESALLNTQQTEFPGVDRSKLHARNQPVGSRFIANLALPSLVPFQTFAADRLCRYVASSFADPTRLAWLSSLPFELG